MNKIKYIIKYILYKFLLFKYFLFSGYILNNNPLISFKKTGLIFIFQSLVLYTIFLKSFLKKVLGMPQMINTIKIKNFIVKLLTKVNNFRLILINCYLKFNQLLII